MTQEDRTERLVVVGDLHLQPDPLRHGRNTADATDVAFHHFVETLTAESDRPAQRHLVLLGDLIDFDRVRHAGRRDEPSARLSVDLLEATHAPFVDALRIAGRAGFKLHVVAGNHDPEWGRPDVAKSLRRLLDNDIWVEIHPWILRMTGRVHAEHGNHFHDLNAMPRPSQPFAPDAPGLHLGSVIDRWSGDVTRIRAASRRAHALGRSVGTMRLLTVHLRLVWRGLGRLIALNAGAERRRRQRYREGDLALYARGIGLRTDAAAALDRLGQVEPLKMARRLAAAARHRGPDTRGQALMRLGAQRLDALLEQFGTSAPLLILAHSHVAEIAALRGGRWYANPGRWAPDLDGAYPYLEIEWDERSMTATLLAWDDATRQRRPISVVQPMLASEARLS